MKLKSKLGIGIAGAALLGGIGATAMAAIPDSDDQEFHACVPNTGTLRSVFFFDKEATPNPCPVGYTEKVWNQAGPVGPTGPQGATGATGPQGPAGTSAEVNIVHVTGGTVTLTGGESAIGTATASCPTGFVATGGGYTSSTTNGEPKKLELNSGSYVVTYSGVNNQTITPTVSCIEGELS